MFWLQTPPHLALTSASRVCAPVLSVSKHKSIVASLTIAPNEPTLYSAFLWMLLQPVISLFTSWTAHTQTERQRARLLRSVWGQKARQRAALSQRQQRPPRLWLQREERSPHNWDKAVVTPPLPSPPVHLSSGHQSLRLPFAMRKSTRSSRMPRPLSYPPHSHFGDHILMEMNLLAPLFRAQRGGIWRAQESLSPHNVGPADWLRPVMPGAQTAPALLSREVPTHSLKFWNLECPFFSLWCNENGLCAHA